MEQTVLDQPTGRASARWARRFRLRGLIAYIALLTLAFMTPLTHLITYALRNDLHSHVPLVPLVSAYLLYTRWRGLKAEYQTSAAAFGGLAAAGLVALASLFAWRTGLSENDSCTLLALAYVSLLVAGAFLFLGASWVLSAAFPIAFLMFMIPLPDGVVNWLELASAAASSETAALYFAAAGTALVRDRSTFELPGIVLEVAQECSGIRSSWAMFITSVLAANMFLKSHWRRLAIVAFVIPLGILRNGLRVFVIGLLCVHVGPHMIESPIHRQGGPLFFALSLIPLFLALEWLRRQERRENRRAEKS